MGQKLQHEKDYDQKLCIDCPYCHIDRPGHSCRNCYSEMEKDICWKLNGFCSEKCQKYITEELPRQRKEKIDTGIKCQCDEPNCAKCLGINCQDKNCPTHTKELKEVWRRRWEMTHKQLFPYPKNY